MLLLLPLVALGSNAPARGGSRAQRSRRSGLGRGLILRGAGGRGGMFRAERRSSRRRGGRRW